MMLGSDLSASEAVPIGRFEKRQQLQAISLMTLKFTEYDGAIYFDEGNGQPIPQ